MSRFPEAIDSVVGEAPFAENKVGMSGSRVLIFDDYVLKIQPKSEETDNEIAVISRLWNRIPIPRMAAIAEENGAVYELMTRVRGEMLCEEHFLRNPKELVRLATQGLRILWGVDIAGLPCGVSALDERLKAARRNVESGKVDPESAEPETFGPGGFSDPKELLIWLETHRPAEDLVLTHGDFCLPNVFADHGVISGYIDLGKMGMADRWQDIAILLRSMEHNCSGFYHNGVPFCDFEPQMFLDELGIKMDEEKNRYYRLLDELF